MSTPHDIVETYFQKFVARYKSTHDAANRLADMYDADLYPKVRIDEGTVIEFDEYDDLGPHAVQFVDVIQGNTRTNVCVAFDRGVKNPVMGRGYHRRFRNWSVDRD